MEVVLLNAFLRLAWAIPIFLILTAFIPIPSLRPFREMIATFASRGKTWSPSSSKRFTVPQKYFLHFYVLAVLWTTCLLASTWFYARRKMVPLGLESLNFSTVAGHLAGASHAQYASVEQRNRVWNSVFVLLLMDVHVLRRLYESLYVFNYGRSARMHLLGYFTGLFFYVAAPLSLCISVMPEVLRYTVAQLAEIIIKGKKEVPMTAFNWWGFGKSLTQLETQLGWFQLIGTIIFIWGWMHQFRCHAILGSLRKRPGTDEYVVPEGDWFEIVSCPHYLAEIVIYAGILLGTGGLDLTVWLLFLFVTSNLIFAAVQTHKWYQYKFENYPPSRSAIIPRIC